MEIEITSLLEMDCFALSHSWAEGGQNAGQETWQASLDEAEETVLLDTPEKISELKDYARGLGAWEDDEIDAWTGGECNAFFLQDIAGQVRESGADTLADIPWKRYRKDQQSGRVSSNIYKSGRRLFFYLGH